MPINCKTLTDVDGGIKYKTRRGAALWRKH